MFNNNINASKLIEVNKSFKFAKRKSFKTKIQDPKNEPNSKAVIKFVGRCQNSSTQFYRTKWSSENDKQFLIHLRDHVPNNSSIYVTSTG